MTARELDPEYFDMKQVVRGTMMMGLLMLVAGCYEHTFTTGTGAPTGPSKSRSSAPRAMRRSTTSRRSSTGSYRC